MDGAGGHNAKLNMWDTEEKYCMNSLTCANNTVQFTEAELNGGYQEPGVVGNGDVGQRVQVSVT